MAKQRRKYWRYFVHERKTFYIGVKGFRYRNVWGELDAEGYLTLYEHSTADPRRQYRFNGASPKCFFSVLDIWRPGTPDGEVDPGTNLPKMFWVYAVHDYLFQFRRQIGFTYAQCNHAFLEVGLTTTFKALMIYYYALRLYWGIASRVFLGDLNERKKGEA